MRLMPGSNVGTTAAASRRSVCTRPGTAMIVARSAASRTVKMPSGLSSRTTSPVSVTHEVVRSPANTMSTRNAGKRVAPTRTTSRSPTSRTTGALLRVAGSNSIHSWRAPGTSPSLASLRPRLAASRGGSASVRVSVRVRPPVVSSRIRRHGSAVGQSSVGVPSEVPEAVRSSASAFEPDAVPAKCPSNGPSSRPVTETGPVPGSSENWNERRVNVSSTSTVV